MSNNGNDQWDRRKFLQCALGVAGIAALGVPDLSRADASEPALVAKGLSIAKWNGHEFIAGSSHKLAPATTLRTVRVTLCGHTGETPNIRTITAYFPVDIDGTRTMVPFIAWMAGRYKSQAISFNMPVHPEIGINLSFETQTEHAIRLATEGTGDAPLSLGTYIIAASDPVRWQNFTFDESAANENPIKVAGRDQSVTFDYATVTIEQA